MTREFIGFKRDWTKPFETDRKRTKITLAPFDYWFWCFMSSDTSFHSLEAPAIQRSLG